MKNYEKLHVHTSTNLCIENISLDIGIPSINGAHEQIISFIFLTADLKTFFAGEEHQPIQKIPSSARVTLSPSIVTLSPLQDTTTAAADNYRTPNREHKSQQQDQHTASNLCIFSI